MTKAEPTASETATSRRSNRAPATPASSSATTTAKKPKTEAAAAAAVSATEPPVVKRGPGRPRGSTSKKTAIKTADNANKTPARRGRKPKTATVTAAAEAGGVAIDDQVSSLDVKKVAKAKKEPKDAKTKVTKAPAATKEPKAKKEPKATKEPKANSEVKQETKTTTTTVAAKPGRKRKLDVNDETAETTPKKRGRPAKKAAATTTKAAKASAPASAVTEGSKASTTHDEDTEGAYSGIKLTIERCTTCTQYHKNVLRIFKVAKDLYPNALLQEEIVPNSKSFEIYVSIDGAKNKRIWSGKAHAPPKRLAFPDSDVFVKLLKDELKEE